MNQFNVISINASRIRNLDRIKDLLVFVLLHNPSVAFIQEINICGALKVFSPHFQVYVNMESRAHYTDGVGIVTVVRPDIKILESIIGSEGRILGIKIPDVQLWHVYPISGGGHKKDRERFFRETLNNYMMCWKDSTRFLVQAGDHNCTHRLLDSENNPKEKYQDGLVKHLSVHGLKDDFIAIHGDNQICYSRVTPRSKTRIDYIFSNIKECTDFKYIDTGLNFDHKASYAKYNISVLQQSEFIPKVHFYQSWVLPKNLEHDEEFLNSVKWIFDSTKDQIIQSKEDTLDISYYWVRAKMAVVKIARERQACIKRLVHERINVLNIFYMGVLENIQNGDNDAFLELGEIKKELNEIYSARAEQAVDNLKGLLIDDQVYDIHKLQQQKKFENNGKIKEIKIGDTLFSGTASVVEAIAGVMKDELKVGCSEDFDSPANDEEVFFLNKMKGLMLTEKEKEGLLAPTTEDEIGAILKFEVDKDSSPGDDGITYRFMQCFWAFPSYRFLYVKYLNYTREIGSLGLEKNNGIMVVKNKKAQSIEYNKKRKLTKVNKDSNLGNGKVWTNRLKKYIMDKVLPKTQFNCQDDVNIIDELREIRNVNQYLLGDDVHGQINGTILSIDFDNAYRSTYLRWFNLVMKGLGFPPQFIQWFWTMYKDLTVTIVINKYKSESIPVRRGFMEGSPPSMAAFVLCLAPLMVALEEVLAGIQTSDDKVHKVKAFADDMKLFVSDPEEITSAFNVICKFEAVSGLKMHRDPRREKCQALPFGAHRTFQNWPDWVTVKDSVKVVGAWFSNSNNLEKMNGDLIKKSFYDALHKAWGTRGTVQQKVHFVNTYLFPKIWYLSQVFILDKSIFYGEKKVKGILAKALEFIWAGENERPIRALNFRSKEQGGLGLVEPFLKSKAFLVKNMLIEYKMQDYDPLVLDTIYGDRDVMLDIIALGKTEASVKDIYSVILNSAISRNGSLIPSREEKRCNLKWKRSWENLSKLKGVLPAEKMFAWKMCQDMLPVGVRIHRANAERRCLVQLENGDICTSLQDRNHVFRSCDALGQSYSALEVILEKFLEKIVEFKEILHLAFSHRKLKKVRVACWLVIKWLYFIWSNRNGNKVQVLMAMSKEITWMVRRKNFAGSRNELLELQGLVNDILQN